MTKRKKKQKLKLPIRKSLNIILLILSICEAVCIIVQAAFLGKAIVALFNKDYNILTYSVLFLLGYVGRVIFLHLQQHFVEKDSIQLEKKLRRELLTSYFNLGYDFLTREGTGKLVTLSIEGIGQVKHYFELTVSKKMRSVVLPVFIMAFIILTDYVSGLMIISVIPVIVIFMILLGINAKEMADRQYKKYRVLSNNFIDTIRGIETLKFLGISKKYRPILDNKSAEYRKSTLNTLKFAFLNSFALDFLTTIAIAFLAVRLGILLIDGETYLLPALTVLLIAPEFFLPMKQAATDYHATLNGQIAYEEIMKVVNNKNAKIDDIKQLAEISSVEFKNVSFVKDEKEILKNINFKIEKNSRICIVGESGGGKSTLISLLTGFNSESSGDIFVNGDKVSLKNSNWLSNISYIPQFPYIFPDTIKNNILFYENNDVTFDKVKEVCKIVGLDKFIESLPDGYDTYIGETGSELSGGQAQRIAIARALISEREIVVLDEPTSHLDIETEFDIKEQLLKLFHNKTVIIATHRLHWLNDMDYILHISNGEVVDYTKFSEYKNSEKYNNLLAKLGGSYDEK